MRESMGKAEVRQRRSAALATQSRTRRARAARASSLARQRHAACPPWLPGSGALQRGAHLAELRQRPLAARRQHGRAVEARRARLARAPRARDSLRVIELLAQPRLSTLPPTLTEACAS